MLSDVKMQEFVDRAVGSDSWYAVWQLVQEVHRLRAAITKHHDQRADDRCWFDDAELYEAVGLTDHDASVGDPEAMLANCKRFIAQRCQPGGEWKSYVELEREVVGLRKANALLLSGMESQAELLHELKQQVRGTS